MLWILLYYQFVHGIVGLWATSENIPNFWGWKSRVALLLPLLPPFSTTIRMSWRIASEPIWRSESNCVHGFSVPPLVFALPAKTFLLMGRGKFRKLEVGFEIFKCSLVQTVHRKNRIICNHFHREPDIMTDLNLQEIHDFAVDLAKQAGKMILKASNSRLSSTSSSTAEKLNCPSPPIQL